MNKLRTTGAAILLCTTLFIQTAGYGGYTTTASAAPTAPQGFTLDQLGTIALKNGVSVKLTDVNLMEQDNGNILTYSLSYTNGTNSSVLLKDYFNKVTTPGGTVVQGNTVTSSTYAKSIPAKSTQSVTYYVNIGKANKINGMKISLYTWDFNSADFRRQLGTFTVPAAYSIIVPQDQSKNLTLNNQPVSTKAESLQIYKYNGKVYAKVGISFSNLGTKALEDLNLKGYLASVGGSIFKLSLDDTAGANHKVQPKEKKTIFFLTEIPSYIKTDKMRLQFSQEDSALKIELPVASYNLPAATTPNLVVPSTVVKKILISNNTVETELKSAKVAASGNSAKWALKFRVKNSGNKSVTLPAYKLEVKASEGFSFPVDSKAFASLTLKPLEEKTIDLTAEVPLSIDQAKLQLQLVEPAAEGKIIFPTAYYQIPYSLQSNQWQDSEYMVDNNHGKFGVKFVNIQRLPWLDKDQMVVKINIRNLQSTSVQLPTLKGIVMAEDNNVSGTSQVVTEDTQTILAPNETVAVYVLFTVPYAYTFNHLKIELQETVGEEKENFLTLNTTQLYNQVKEIEPLSPFKLELVGKKAEVVELLTTVYPGTGSNIMYTELVMTNEEKRRADQAQLVAYYKTQDNYYYEAKVSQSETPPGPNGKSLVTVWSKIPANVDPSKLVLYLGAGVADGKLTSPGGKPTGFINTVSLGLNMVTEEPQNNLLGINMSPYTLSITDANATVTVGSDTLNAVLNYNLEVSNLYEAGPYEHKLVLELVDPLGQSMSQTLNFGTDLQVGSFKRYAMTLTSNGYKTLDGGAIRLNVYDEFQGQRKLLATQTYKLTTLRKKTDQL
ncbi:hypothetical protein ACFRAM_21095 [Paenibacillus sp. NPDC056722]|uniref:hypothetical protein n=1 Tax=Paenibacillus sp. NPDC056722 TaxID=3345924 RepID=UPI0036B39CED